MSGSCVVRIPQPWLNLQSNSTGVTLSSMMNNPVLFLLALGAFSFSSPAYSLPVKPTDLLLEVTGHIYPKDILPASCQGILQGVKCEVAAYGRYHMEMKKEGELVHNYVTFSGPEGDQVLEQSWEKNGKVQKAFIENRAIQKRSQLEIKNGKVYYEVVDLKDNSVKKSEDLAEDNLVVPSTIMKYIDSQSEKITKGETVVLKVAVLDRRDSFTFNVKKIKDDKAADGEPIQVLEMAPASFIVKAAVDPMYFYVHTKTGDMFAFEGESGLRRKVGNSYEKMKVRTAYEYRRPDAVATKDSKTKSTPGCETPDFMSGKNPAKCEVKQ